MRTPARRARHAPNAAAASKHRRAEVKGARQRLDREAGTRLAERGQRQELCLRLLLHVHVHLRMQLIGLYLVLLH